MGNIQSAMERQRLEIIDVDSLRLHYALTLWQWVMRLERQHERALHFVSESIWRVRRLYMATCALEFESGEIGDCQVLANKRGAGSAALPLTRRRLYAPAPAGGPFRGRPLA